MFNLILFFIFPLSLISCNKGGEYLKAQHNVEIYRSLLFNEDSALYFHAFRVKLDLQKRTITLEGVVNIMGGGSGRGKYAVASIIKIKDSSLTVTLPNDAPYHIYINRKFYTEYYFLPAGT
jgi:hypothetical protein